MEVVRGKVHCFDARGLTTEVWEFPADVRRCTAKSSRNNSNRKKGKRAGSQRRGREAMNRFLDC
jgi:hypothetical protein